MTLSFEKLNNENVIRDNEGRVIVFQKESKISIARFPDMDEKTKEYVANVYADLTGRSADKAMQFLNYRTDENEFCS